ncbi:MAG TPA: TIGR02391 family protein [Rhizobiales bacterium]|nr:protein of unknown function [bacterium BMS3Bbin10]HDO52586.1 TIGR02391 family protein [Hyphomicrobiales bacterium]
MVRRASPTPEPLPANLSAGQIKAAIPKLERRLRELEAVSIDCWDDAIKNELDALQMKVEETLSSVFGPNTLELKRYEVVKFWLHVPMWYNRPSTPQELVDGYTEAISKAISKLKTAVSLLEEQLDDMGESPGGQALRAYEGLDLHSEIDRAAGRLYQDGHHANAIENAVKALNGLVRLRSGIDDKDGTSLMELVFSPKNPILKFNDLADESDHNEQRGFMMMFSGAVAGLRNPRAHKLIDDDAERALEFIAFVSLLAKLLDEAVKA